MIRTEASKLQQSVKHVPLSKLICEVQSGFASGERSASGVIQLRMNNVKTDGTLDWSDFIRVPTTPAQEKKYALRTGDIVFNVTNSPELVGKTSVFEPLREPVVFSNHFYRLRVHEHAVDPQYLAWWLNIQWQQRVFERLATNWVNQASVRKEDLLSLEIPLPPLFEQQRIAAILAKADRMRRLRRYALELGDGYLQAVFRQMFLGRNTESWPLVTVGELAERGQSTIRTGPFGSQLLHSEFVNAGIPVLGIDNVVQNRFVWAKPRHITEAKYRELRRYTVFPGDVLITIMGTTGKCAIAPQNLPTCINTKHLCCITLDERRCLPIYLHAAFLMHPKVLQQLGISERGAIMPGLNMGLIKELTLPLPPPELQETYARIVEKHTRLSAQQREALRQAEHLFQTLLHRAFTGGL